ncbi:DUF5333 domain-containing protein [Pseudooceanicola algae]|uniref:DUF5333 domain-containing protein n=1 Tax=Pseudooceanicola algae TaxID=1537215 RepID=A0A418SFE7_9RHOB|nr:DUF5333 domain-containing protein [Pseudooceanicola algae]QPM89278.1 hypothetical protein PSAL_004930 [Pseudooceanicola algae]
MTDHPQVGKTTPFATRLSRGLLVLATGVLMTSAAAAQARQPLREVEAIDQNMLWVAIASEIGEKCDRIAPRMAKGYLFLYQLRDQALDMGYTRDEIEAYVTSDAEKARIRKLGEAYAESQGLNPDVTADLCKLGEIEMARSSQIGVLLKEK